MNFKKSGIILVLMTIMIRTGFSQTVSDSIVTENRLGAVFKQNGHYLTPAQLQAAVASYPDAVALMQKARNNYGISMVLGAAGGFLVGWPLGTAIGGGDPNWTLAGIGAGLIVLSIPFSSAYGKNARAAVEIYNRELRNQPGRTLGLRLGYTGNGLRLSLNF
jgi:hypothetical protein